MDIGDRLRSVDNLGAWGTVHPRDAEESWWAAIGQMRLSDESTKQYRQQSNTTRAWSPLRQYSNMDRTKTMANNTYVWRGEDGDGGRLKRPPHSSCRVGKRDASLQATFLRFSSSPAFAQLMTIFVLAAASGLKCK